MTDLVAVPLFLPYFLVFADWSGKNKEPNPNFLVQISLGGVGVFHVKGVGGQKVRHVLRNPGNQTFWRDIPGYLAGYPGRARKKS